MVTDDDDSFVHGHFVDRCSCGIIVNQCRCMSADKTLTVIKNGCIDCRMNPVCLGCGKTGVDLSAKDQLCIYCFDGESRPEGDYSDEKVHVCDDCKRDHCPLHCPNFEVRK